MMLYKLATYLNLFTITSHCYDKVLCISPSKWHSICKYILFLLSTLFVRMFQHFILFFNFLLNEDNLFSAETVTYFYLSLPSRNVIKKCLVSSFFSSLLDLFHEAIDFSSPSNVLKLTFVIQSPIEDLQTANKATSSCKYF